MSRVGSEFQGNDFRLTVISGRWRAFALFVHASQHGANEQKCQQNGSDCHEGDQENFQIDVAPFSGVPLKAFAGYLTLAPRIAGAVVTAIFAADRVWRGEFIFFFLYGLGRFKKQSASGNLYLSRFDRGKGNFPTDPSNLPCSCKYKFP